MSDFVRDAVREAIVAALFMVPRRRRKAIDRWLRGREEYRKLQRTDVVLMSWGKSGRTWLRLMLSRFYQIRFDLGEKQMLQFDNLKRRNPDVPSVFFTHNNYMRDYTGHWHSKQDYYEKRVVLLVRDPRDVAVSQYFQWKHRMRPVKKLLNDYPPHGAEVSLYDFVMNPDCGMPRIIDYFNGWLQEFPNLQHVLLVRYEDMRADPAAVLGRILAFMGTPATDAELQSAVEFAAYENMKKLESGKVFWLSGRRLLPGDRSNPDSFKVRRAKVGGYRDYFDDAQVAEIDRLLERDLDPALGYGAAARNDAAGNGAAASA